MSAYPAYLAKRLAQFAVVVFIGVNLAFVITHASPIDPVEQSISAVTSFGSTAPEAIAAMRASLQELYGLKGTLAEQYLTFWSRVLRGDFGPSLSAFPTPVSTLIGRALPWTAGLLIVSTLIYAFPRTSLLGAIVLTAYLGGATWAHVRMGGPTFPIVFPGLVAAMVWGGMYLREPRLRELIPLRR